MREHTVRMPRQVHEQIEFLRRQPDFATADVNAPGIEVDPEIAALIALEPRTRPSLLMEPPDRSRWVSVNEAREKGAVVVWPATDTPGTPPAWIKTAFPDLVIEVPRAFERSIQGRLPLLRVGWAVIRPQTAPTASAQ